MAGSIEKVINVNIKDNAAEVEKEFKKLNKTLDDTEEKVIDVNSSFEDVYKDLKPLTSRLGEAEDRLYELALAGKQNTQEYKELLQATANYRQVQLQTDLVVDTAAQTMSQKLGGALEGAASGFALVQGAMGLFGTESEEVEKALLKVQSAMALAQGIEGVRTALPLFKNLSSVIGKNLVGAFSTLRGAIVSTGLGALVVAIGLIIPKIIEWADWTGRAKKEQEKLNESLLDQQTIIKDNRKELEKDLAFREQYARALGKSDDDLLKIQKQNNSERNKAIRQEIDAARERLQALREVDLGVMASSKEEYLELVKNNLNKRREIVKEIKALQSEIEENNKQILLSETQLNTNKENARQKDVDNVKKSHKEIVKETKNHYKELSDLQDEQFRLMQEATYSEQELEIARLVEQYDKKFEIANGNAELELALTQKLKEEIASINSKYLPKEVEQVQETNTQKKASDKEVLDEKIRLTKDGLDLIGSLYTNFAGQSEEQQRKAFEVQKAVSIASATIDGIEGTIAAYKSAQKSPITIAFPAYPAIMAAAAGAFAVNNIRRIGQTTFKSSSSASGGSAPTPSTPNATQQLATPNFNIVGASGVSQTENLAPVKAYVVSADVTTAQALDRNRINNATF
jgi:hypothetical protein